MNDQSQDSKNKNCVDKATPFVLSNNTEFGNDNKQITKDEVIECLKTLTAAKRKLQKLCDKMA